MNRILFSYYTFFLVISLLIFSCKKEESESCSDGIKNQTETGVDCGGPCGNACDTVKIQPPIICTGNLSESIIPLAVGNYWKYGNGTAGYDIKILFKTTLRNREYFNFQFKATSTKEALLREDSAKNIVEYINVQGSSLEEQIYIPANPVLNQEWSYYTPTNLFGKRVVTSVTANIVSTVCNYVNLIEIKEYNESGMLVDVLYLKKGLGIVQISAAGKFKVFEVLLK